MIFITQKVHLFVLVEEHCTLLQSVVVDKKAITDLLNLDEVLVVISRGLEHLS